MWDVLWALSPEAEALDLEPVLQLHWGNRGLPPSDSSATCEALGDGGNHHPIWGTMAQCQGTWRHCGSEAQGTTVAAVQAASPYFLQGKQQGT